MNNLERVYTPNPEKREPVRFFCHSSAYRFWGLLPATCTLFARLTAGRCSWPELIG